MNLFNDVERGETRGADYSEPSYSYLNISGRPMAQRIRGELERWFRDYPAGADKRDLLARFRSLDEEQHLGALLELHTHALFRRLGFEVIPHPDLQGVTTHVDFALAEVGSACRLHRVHHGDAFLGNHRR